MDWSHWQDSAKNPTLRRPALAVVRGRRFAFPIAQELGGDTKSVDTVERLHPSLVERIVLTMLDSTEDLKGNSSAYS